MKLCSNCGMYNDDKNTNCIGCGNVIASPAAMSYAIEPEGTKKSRAAVFSLVMLGLLVGGIILGVIGIAAVDSATPGSEEYFISGEVDYHGFLMTESDDFPGAHYDGTESSLLEGAWYAYDGTMLLEVKQGLAGRYYLNGEVLSYLMIEDGSANIELGDIEKVDEDHYAADLTFRSGSRKVSGSMCFNNDLMMVYADDGTWIALTKGYGDYNVDLADELVGKWSVDGRTALELNEDGTGRFILSSGSSKITEWMVVDNCFIFTEEYKGEEYIDIYRVDIEEDTLYIGYFTYEQTDDGFEGVWVKVELERR